VDFWLKTKTAAMIFSGCISIGLVPNLFACRLVPQSSSDGTWSGPEVWLRLWTSVGVVGVVCTVAIANKLNIVWHIDKAAGYATNVDPRMEQPWLDSSGSEQTTKDLILVQDLFGELEFAPGSYVDTTLGMTVPVATSDDEWCATLVSLLWLLWMG
jgi:hypothetical protein